VLDYQCSVHISEMLKVNNTLVALKLDQNPLGDAGAVDLATALKKNAALVSLRCAVLVASPLRRKVAKNVSPVWICQPRRLPAQL
jgi:hypothetical protein